LQQPNQNGQLILEFNLWKVVFISIIDLFNQEIISYELTERPVFYQVTTMLKKAFKTIPNNTNITLHSDQGWQYQMRQYQQPKGKRNKTKCQERQLSR
jgi:transposase InsO family protein